MVVQQVELDGLAVVSGIRQGEMAIAEDGSAVD